MARDTRKQRGLSRRDFIKSAAAVAASGTMFGSGARVVSAAPVCPEGAGDIALINGRFLTLDGKNTVAGAVTIRGGRFEEIGTVGSLRPCAQTIDLKGATVIPGLIDSHVHFFRCGQNPGHEVRIIETASSVGELQQMISDRIQNLPVPPGDFVTCIGGWNRNALAEKRLPTLAEMDAAAPNNPVYISETGGSSSGLTNTSGKTFFTSKGVAVNATTGVVGSTGGALTALQSVQTDADKARGTSELMDFAVSIGLTTVSDMGGAGPGPLTEGLASYRFALDLWRQGKLKVRQRPFLFSSDDPTVAVAQARIANDFVRTGDDVWRMNGLGERINSNSTSPLNVDAWKTAAANGWTITQHSLTAGEIDFHIAGYQQAAAFGPIDKLRWSLCHVNPISDAQIAAIKAMGIGLNLQGWNYTSNAPAGPPWRKLVDSGIPCGAGTDATNVGAINPWLIMYYMTTMKNNGGTAATPANQQITRLEALKMYTKGSAYLSFDDDRLGSIETGKLADLVVLNDNPLTVTDDQFRKLRSVMTMQAGKVVHGSLS